MILGFLISIGRLDLRIGGGCRGFNIIHSNIMIKAKYWGRDWSEEVPLLQVPWNLKFYAKLLDLADGNF